MEIVSSAFENGGMIPSRYTCDGDNISPPLQLYDVPEMTMSLVVMVDGIDSPSGTMTHWIVWDIPFTKAIAENSVPGVEGSNGFGKISYCGPCPSSGTHSYYFIVYALDTRLNLHTGTSRNEVENAMRTHLIDKGELMGKYGRT